MGVLASSMRLMILLNQKNRLEFSIMGVTEKMSGLQAQMLEIDEFNSDLDPNSATVKQLEADKKRLNNLEAKLQQQQKMMETRLQQVDAEIQACQGMLQRGIQSGLFTYGMMGGR